MSAAAELGAFLALGFLGSLHCVGMCGGFALLASHASSGEAARPAPSRILGRQAAYALGKALSYALLALLLATGVAVLEGGPSAGAAEGPGAPLRSALAVLAGLALVASGVTTLWRLRAPSARLQRWLGAATRPLRRLLGHAEGLTPGARAFCVGALNGLLPCGLSWAAFLFAARLAPPLAAAGAFLFGLATAPALAAVALSLGLASGRWRRRVPSFLGLVLILFGCASLLRSARLALADAALSGECCAPEQVLDPG